MRFYSAEGRKNCFQLIFPSILSSLHESPFYASVMIVYKLHMIVPPVRLWCGANLIGSVSRAEGGGDGGEKALLVT